MLIKSADDRQPDIDALSGLLARPGLSAWTRRNIDQEIRLIRAGVKGERDAAYEIETRFGDSPNQATIHDLRLAFDGHVAQIDHLIINRILQVWVCESKHFADGVSINDHGEWERLGRGAPRGMGSPVLQNAKHIAVLEEACGKGRVSLPRRTGYTVHPEFHSLILISNDARIRRPRHQVEGLDTVIKAEQLPATIDRQVDDLGVLGLLGKAATRLIRQDQLEAFARQLVGLHVPASTNWAAKFGLEGVASHAPPPATSSRLGPATRPAQATLVSLDTEVLPAISEKLVAQLRRWRSERARRDGVPAYVIAEDATLRAIADACPRTPEALGRVRGIGPARLERYGAEILGLVEAVRGGV